MPDTEVFGGFKSLKNTGFWIEGSGVQSLKTPPKKTDLSFSSNNKLGKTCLPVKLMPFKKGKKHTEKESLEYNYFHYSGNDLSTLIDDIKEIKEG